MHMINDGGPAFPSDWPENEFVPCEPGNPLPRGMSLRDWFAGKELAKTSGPLILDEREMYDRLADHCYRMADAMLRAREPRFAETSCSQCGKDLGPGDAGVSHCSDHGA